MRAVARVEMRRERRDLKRRPAADARIRKNRDIDALQVECVLHLPLKIRQENEIDRQLACSRAPTLEPLDEQGAERIVAATGISDGEDEPARASGFFRHLAFVPHILQRCRKACQLIAAAPRIAAAARRRSASAVTKQA